MQEGIDPGAMHSRDEYSVRASFAKLLLLLDGHGVCLVDGDDNWGAEWSFEVRELGEFFECGSGSVDEIENRVSLVECGERGGPHRFLEGIAGIEQTGSVEQHHLNIVDSANADNS